MEYRTVSTKLPSNELTLFRVHCEKKGVTPASLIRDLILREMKFTIPHTVAGKNKIAYNKNNDSFTWSIELDMQSNVDVLRDFSPAFIENLFRIIQIGINERNSFIQKKKNSSVPVPSDIFRRKKDD